MGARRFELRTSPLSGVRSSHLSYRPAWIRPRLNPFNNKGLASQNTEAKTGGAGRDRTGDLLSANQALSQLSYSPACKSSEAGWTQRSTSYTRGLQAKLPELQVEIRTRLSARSEKPAEVYGMERLPTTLSLTPSTFSLRKEVIQPQVLLRLPCYDFTPIMSHTLERCLPCGLACALLVQPTFVM